MDGNDAKEHATTSTNKVGNPWYGVFCDALEKKLNCNIEPQVFPAATDSRFLRALGIRALGFSPMRNTEIMLHENDEYIPEKTYLEGISVYVTLIRELGQFLEPTTTKASNEGKEEEPPKKRPREEE